MPEAVVIRPATPADLSGLADLLDSPLPFEGGAVDPETQRRGLEMMLNNGRGCVLAAQCADGTVIGLCAGQLTISTAEGGPAVLIKDVVVREDWRGQGIGARLMETMGRWAKGNEAGRLHCLADLGGDCAQDFSGHVDRRGTRLPDLHELQ